MSDDVTTCLEVLATHGGLEAITAPGRDGWTPAHFAAFLWGVRGDSLKALAKLGAASTFSSLTTGGEYAGRTPASLAVEQDNFEVFEMLATHGGPEALTAPDADGCTPAHRAVHYNRVAFLVALGKLGAGSSFTAIVQERINSPGYSPAGWAAVFGHTACIEPLFTYGGLEALTVMMPNAPGRTQKLTPAHIAALGGHASFLREMAAHGAASTFCMGPITPAFLASMFGHAECLEVFAAHGALRTLTDVHETRGTPAHVAAAHGHVQCLETLHRLLTEAADHDLKLRSELKLATAADAACEKELSAQAQLAQRCETVDLPPGPSETRETPAELALRAGTLDCLQYLVRIGGAARLHAKIRASPAMLDSAPYDTLLSRPGLLNFACKQAWLQHILKSFTLSGESGRTFTHPTRCVHWLDSCFTHT